MVRRRVVRVWSLPHLISTLFIFLTLSPATAHGDTYHWLDHFAGVGFDGPVSDLVVFDGDLVVAGNFARHSTLYAKDVARWDGAHWYAMGDPGLVEATAVGVYNGDLYLHGFFGGVQGPLLRWNGVEWDAVKDLTLASPFSIGYAQNMVEFDGKLVIEGSVCCDGHCRLFTFDGAFGGSVGIGPDLQTTFADVFDMIVFQGDLYVAGDFVQREDALPMTGVARWDGSTWTAVEGRSYLGGPLIEGIHGGTYYGDGYALAEFDDKLIIAGDFTLAGDLPVSNVCSWDPVTQLWDDVGGGRPDVIWKIAASGGSVYAAPWDDERFGGSIANLGRWNGTGWSVVDGGNSGVAYDLMDNDGTLILGGTFKSAGGVQAERVAWWDGSNFSGHHEPGGNGMDDTVYDLTGYDGELVAVGEFDCAGTTVVNHVASWNGVGWNAFDSGVDGDVRAVLSEGTDLIVGGSFTQAGGLPATYVARWDGASWNAYGSAPSGAVSSMCIHDGQLHVGGEIDGSSDGFIERWDGSNWQSIPLETYNLEVRALESYHGDLYAGSAFWVFPSGGGDLLTPVARWDGSNWHALLDAYVGTIGDVVHNLYLYDDLLYIQGDFGPGMHTAVWNDTVLTEIEPTTVNGSAPVVSLAIARFDARFYVGGLFSPYLWSAEELDPGWTTAFGGVNSTVYSLYNFQGTLYLGGEFREVGTTGTGGVFSSCIAKLYLPPVGVSSPATPSRVRLYQNAPNPFNPTTRIRFEVPGPGGQVELAVYDARGRKVRTLISEPLEGGPHTATWDGRNDAGAAVASGVYLYRLDVDGTSLARKMIILK